MKRKSLLILVVLAALGLGAFLVLRPDAREREIRRVRQQLNTLATEASFAEGEPVFRKLAYPSRVLPFFVSPTEIDITVGRFSAEARTITRSELETGAASIRATIRGIRIEFLDIEVELADAEATNATAHLTSRIFVTGDSDYTVQELRFQMEKSEGSWKVRKIAPVRTMQE